MHSDDLEEVMTKFVNGEADVLLSTTIIESGLDIPNANTIIIDRADRFGLSDLYQLRGRVGRYKHQAYAYLLLPRHARPAHRRAQAHQRHQAILHARQRLQNRHARPGNPRRGQPARRGAKRPHHRGRASSSTASCSSKASRALKGEKVKPRVEVQRARWIFCEPDSRRASKSAGASREHPASVIVPHAYYVPEPQHRIEIYRKLAQATDKAALESLAGNCATASARCRRRWNCCCRWPN